MSSIMTATDTYLLLRALCDELARCGLQHACTSPGSRSTPIVLSLAREPRIRCWSHLDERCAGFFALGAAKASARPVAVACTSGTAAANFAPAVIEAHWARVPLIVLTADRPPELRDVGAGQTIDQLKLYGDAVKWFFEVDVPAAGTEQLRWIRALACRAYWTAAGGVPGPVHLNLPAARAARARRSRCPTMAPDAPAASRTWPEPPAVASASGRRLELPARGVVVAGRDERQGGLADAAVRFAQRAGYPLAGRSAVGRAPGAGRDRPLRPAAALGRSSPAACGPQLVIRLGDLPTSKPLRTWLAGLADVHQVAFDPEGAWQDPATVVGERLAAAATAALPELDPPVDPEWLAAWRSADAARRSCDRGRARRRALRAAGRPLRWLRGSAREATLFVASSMPIRDVEEFAPASDGRGAADAVQPRRQRHRRHRLRAPSARRRSATGRWCC